MSLAIVVGLTQLLGFLQRFPRYRLAPVERPKGLYHYRGQLHVHTRHSKDATGSIDEILRAAAQEKQDFVVVLDHNSLAAATREGYHGNVLLIVGAEASDRRGHIAALNLAAPSLGRPIERWKTPSVTAWLTHPMQPGRRFDLERFNPALVDGLEILNGGSIVKRAIEFPYTRLAAALYFYPLNPSYGATFLLSRPDETLALWDRWSATTRKTGLFGIDAHGRVSYRRSFALASTHLLLDAPLTHNAADDRRRVIDAIKKGRVYSAFDALAPGDGFWFVGEARNFARRQRVLMGDTLRENYQVVALRADAGLQVGDGDLRFHLFRDGVEVARRAGKRFRIVVSTRGCYRIEVELRVRGMLGGDRFLPWLFSNAICLAKPFSSLLR
ncbi:MAG: PHP domain-containing protein [Myxococcales bacterium]|nr:PHP domain-containing protein [Myxococcales bacterium]